MSIPLMGFTHWDYTLQLQELTTLTWCAMPALKEETVS